MEIDSPGAMPKRKRFYNFTTKFQSHCLISYYLLSVPLAKMCNSLAMQLIETTVLKLAFCDARM